MAKRTRAQTRNTSKKEAEESESSADEREKLIIKEPKEKLKMMKLMRAVKIFNKIHRT